MDILKGETMRQYLTRWYCQKGPGDFGGLTVMREVLSSLTPEDIDIEEQAYRWDMDDAYFLPINGGCEAGYSGQLRLHEYLGHDAFFAIVPGEICFWDTGII